MKNLLHVIIFICFCFSNLTVFAACPLNKIQNNEFCGGAAPVVSSEPKNKTVSQQDLQGKDLQEILRNQNMATPFFQKNGFPILKQNCMFGNCLPDLR